MRRKRVNKEGPPPVKVSFHGRLYIPRRSLKADISRAHNNPNSARGLATWYTFFGRKGVKVKKPLGRRVKRILYKAGKGAVWFVRDTLLLDTKTGDFVEDKLLRKHIPSGKMDARLAAEQIRQAGVRGQKERGKLRRIQGAVKKENLLK